MGMDVFGKNPTSESGEYFRNNVWWWRRLWDYCVLVAPELCEGVNGQYNDGDGLNGDDSLELARLLREQLESGLTAEFERQYNIWRSELPRETCNYCEGTGIRTDAVGVEQGMTTRELATEVAILVGRTHGTCNACSGVGTNESWEASYPFSVENVREFAEFLENCGGFSIC